MLLILSLNIDILKSMSQKFGVWLLCLYFAFGAFFSGGVCVCVFLQVLVL